MLHVRTHVPPAYWLRRPDVVRGRLHTRGAAQQHLKLVPVGGSGGARSAEAGVQLCLGLQEVERGTVDEDWVFENQPLHGLFARWLGLASLVVPEKPRTTMLMF